MSTTRRPPIWAHPAPGSRKPRFSREQIAEIAMTIADQEGFDAVSMRRIADELDAGTMTLYHYVRTKEDLIALMDDAIMAEVLVPPERLGRDWVTALGAIARASYHAFVRHPWAMSALQGARFGPNSMLHIEQSLMAVARAPFDAQGKLDAIGIVDDYVFGHAYRRIEIQRHSELIRDAPSEQLVEFTRAQLATGAYPELEAMVGDDVAGAWVRIAQQLNDAHRFERGLGALFEGLLRTLPRAGGRARARSRTRTPPRPRLPRGRQRSSRTQRPR